MSKAMILVETDRVEWCKPTRTAGGGLLQEVRLHERDECKVVMLVTFPADSEAAKAFVDEKPPAHAIVDALRPGSVTSDAVAG